MAEAGKQAGELIAALSVRCETPAIAETSEYLTASDAIRDAIRDATSDAGAAEPGSSNKCAAAAAAADEEPKYMTAGRRQLGNLRSNCNTEEEFEIEKSREHWTIVGRPSSENDLLYAANRQHFQSLLTKYKMTRSSRRFHARWPRLLPKHEFFRDYGDSLEVGRKIAEGGQAEILEATLDGTEKCVVKVYKNNHSLADLERYWTFTPHGETLSGKNSSLKLFRNKCCFIKGGTLLKDGRFGFVMKRYWGDLRKFIDLRIESRTNSAGTNFHDPPFQYPLPIILEIARGMRDLHKSDILHRDLKASNILIGSADSAVCDADMNLDEDMEKGVERQASSRKKRQRLRFHCYIADFESSKVCRGTRFWRAPEVLRGVKNGCVSGDPEIWTKKVDVYSYAMTCYEVLTGCVPLQNLAHSDYDAVIKRDKRPPLPDYVDDRVKDLLRRCWHSEPNTRPTFVQVVRELEALRRSEPTYFFTNYNRGVE